MNLFTCIHQCKKRAEFKFLSLRSLGCLLFIRLKRILFSQKTNGIYSPSDKASFSKGFHIMQALYPVLLLTASNIFMTFAWYGHLKFKSASLWTVILVSWGIAFFEYCLQVPANRIGHEHYSAAQLKGMQEVITLTVFAVFSVLYLGEPVKWNHIAGFALLVCAGFLIFKK